MVKSLSGQSAFSAEMLRSMIDETQAAIAGAEEELRACEGESASETEQMKQLRAKFQEIADWADAFEHLHGDARKMILSRIIERITVDRDYNLTITFYITREEFEGKYADNEAINIEQALAAPSLRLASV